MGSLAEEKSQENKIVSSTWNLTNVEQTFDFYDALSRTAFELP
jgi:hypothetical protein